MAKKKEKKLRKASICYIVGPRSQKDAGLVVCIQEPGWLWSPRERGDPSVGVGNLAVAEVEAPVEQLLPEVVSNRLYLYNPATGKLRKSPKGVRRESMAPPPEEDVDVPALVEES